MDIPTPSPSDHSEESSDSSMSSLDSDLLKQDGDTLLSPLFLFPGEATSQSSSSNSSSQHSGSPRNDWALPGPMWGQVSESKAQNLDLSSLNLSLNFPSALSQDHWSSMDMDTDISAFMSDPPRHLSIDPHSLHFHDTVHGELQGQMSPTPDFDSIFQFTLSQPPPSVPGPVPQLQIFTPKSGPMLSRSVSPALSKLDHDSSAGVNPSDLSLLTQLGQKARDAAGVMSAVPANHSSQIVADGQVPLIAVSPILAGISDPRVTQSESLIPHLRPSVAVSQKSQFDDPVTSQPTPPSSQPSSSPPLAQADAAVAIPTTTKSGRPKTSHTTIERRYRTNLNARILALRRAVPALRILEKNTANQTQGKGLTGASAGKWDFNDVVNERGYVDGVKAAKKNSKGVVLGKAVEYIKALKRREIRLKRESGGLRALLSGLVGGPELLREWEKEWRERFGGEEADEVDEDAEDNEEGDADVDEGDDAEEGESDDEDGRAKKRARVEKKERKVRTPSAPQAEKRKRGRPKKNPISDASAAGPHLILQPPDVQDQRQPSKYLLAAFLFFSFYNSNTPTPTSGSGHEGAVLTHVLPDTGAAPANTAGWTFMQAVHMLVSVLLIFSLFGQYVPKKLKGLLPDALFFLPTSSTSPRKGERPLMSTSPLSLTRDVALSRALASGNELALRKLLGADGTLYSVVKGMGLAMLRAMKQALHIRGGPVTRHMEIELRAWRRMCHLEALSGEKASLLMKLQAYLTLSSCLSSSSTLPSDNITLALLAYSFDASTATDLWAAARRSDIKTASEAIVLEMDVEEAAKLLVTIRAPLPDQCDGLNEERLSPVHRIAAHIVLTRTKALAARQFVCTVSGSRIVDLDGYNSFSTSPSHDPETKVVLAAGRELGGTLGELTNLLDKVGRCPAAEILAGLPSLEFEFEVETDGSDASCSESGGDSNSGSIDTSSDDPVKDTRILLLATLLYSRIFPFKDTTNLHVLSPPPSPTPKSAALHLVLRRALASAAFDTNPDTEDARDRVVDVLAETRKGR